MANLQHASLTGASLHEPKGVAAAANHTVYVANGSGSGTWQKISKDEINTSSIKNSNLVFLSFNLVDLNPAASYYMPIPIAGAIIKITTTIDGSFTGSNNILSFEINNVAVTNGNITITQSGSAAGDVDSSTPTAANVLTAGQALEIISDGGASSTVKCTIVITLDVS